MMETHLMERVPVADAHLRGAHPVHDGLHALDVLHGALHVHGQLHVAVLHKVVDRRLPRIQRRPIRDWLPEPASVTNHVRAVCGVAYRSSALPGALLHRLHSPKTLSPSL